MFTYLLPHIGLDMRPAIKNGTVTASSCVDLVKKIPGIYRFDKEPLHLQLSYVMLIMTLVLVDCGLSDRLVSDLTIKNGGLRPDV